ncbi:alanine racemase [Caulobacter mirabilis]|uniref:Threonine aldolase n=1 Tax=Caulobacter mirabilis TaxID=69666 RepID=A0A2D2ASF1_9CAUL|nr:alanine racemase [Caulobacter mirabilis]ATQ40929.1 threonine aldolase [Caulobacter mirabilis]
MIPGFVPPQTPLLVVRRSALDRNLDAMQRLCDLAGVRLRAHGKTHKCSTLGRQQVETGAVGLCAQTVGEAEAFARGGISDILVTAPHAPWGAHRLAALAVGGARIGATVDSAEQIERLGEAARTAGAVLDCVIDVDPGTHRTGAHPSRILELARLAADTEGLNYAGIQAYAGHLQHLSDVPARKAADEGVFRMLAGLVADLRAADLAPGVVTGGGTGTHAWDLASGVFTELQAGSYAFMDVEYEDCGAPEGGWPFEASLFVVASAISANHKSHVTIDAGFKAMAVDGPPARVVAGAAKGALWRPMGDEHGMILDPSAIPMLKGGSFVEAVDNLDADVGAPWPAEAPKAGDLVWLQIGHCDPTINLYDALHVVAEDGSWERWPIDARRVS